MIQRVAPSEFPSRALMNLIPSNPLAQSEYVKRGSKALLWLLVFAYVPFLLAHGFETWSQPAVDFPPIYSATKVTFDQHRSPYGENAFAEQALALGRPVPPYIYPPPSLLLMYPLHFFSYDTAKALMLVVNHLCLLFATIFLFRRLFREDFTGARNQFTAAFVIIYILLFDPAVVTLHLGQVNLLLLVGICFTWNAVKRNASAVAIALPLSLAIVVKTYPVLLLPLLVFRRRYKAAALTVGLFALYCVASYLLLPKDIWSDWLTKVMPAGSEAHAGPWNQNIRAFLARAFAPNPFTQPLVEWPGIVKPLIIALSLPVFGASIWATLRVAVRPDTARSVDVQMSLVLFMIFLIAPLSWEHHFVYLLPSLILVLLMLLSGEIRGHWRWITAISLCLIAWKLPFGAPWLTKGIWIFGISIKFYPAIALWIFFLLKTLRLNESDAIASGGSGHHEPEPALVTARG